MRVLGVFNLLGVALLAVLSAVQWNANRAVHLRATALDKTRLEQVRKIEDHEATIAATRADLEDFRGRLARLRDDLDATDRQFRRADAARARAEDEGDAVRADRDQVLADRDRVAANVDLWAAAVEERDDALRQMTADLLTVARQRDETAQKFNDLAEKYNGIVKELNEARSKPRR